MSSRIIKLFQLFPVALLALTVMASASALAQTAGTKAGAFEDGIVRVKSAYPLVETVTRLKQDISSKGVVFFMEVDQSQLAANAGIQLRPSTLLIFGNPPLGSLFITANPQACLDWPVRLLVHEDEKGDVWAVYSDFDWIARRHGITNRDKEFKAASMVIASITSSVAAK